MTCPRCNRAFRSGEPHFCAPADRQTLYKTSTVLITVGGSDRIYRSIDEAPEHLRKRFEKAAMACDSASIVIADRGGREKIEDALNLVKTEPEPAPQPPSSTFGTVVKLAAIAAILALTALVLIWLVLR